jgi:hypothetical protein
MQSHSPDASSDLCFGSGLVSDICFDTLPAGAVKLGGTIDTTMVGGANCTEIVAQTAGPSMCVVAADSIAIDPDVVATATGTNPLVLIATTTIAIDGTLDVSSRSTGATGAGAQMMCGSISPDGGDASNTNAGGGAAGGSFGTVGSGGGKGNGGTSPGTVGPTQAPTFLVGGCPGGTGGAGGGGLEGGGPAGRGGGGVYLIAHTSITLGTGGSIDASGGGGGAGGAGTNSGGGAGGGGSGGVIGLDAPTIAGAGSIFANGGGGGGGNGNDFDKPGNPGKDSLSPTDHALGGTGGTGGGGNGGNGYASGTDATPGANGSAMFCGGGGGGGGAGIIHVFQSTLPATTAVSPPAS